MANPKILSQQLFLHFSFAFYSAEDEMEGVVFVKRTTVPLLLLCKEKEREDEALPAVRVIHSDPSAFECFAINCLNHFGSSIFINFYPTVHFLHVYSAQHIFFQVAHVENELQEARFIKAILGAEVYKQPRKVSTTGKFSSACIPRTRLVTIAGAFISSFTHPWFCTGIKV
jgi:hypothetical protein